MGDTLKRLQSQQEQEFARQSIPPTWLAEGLLPQSSPSLPMGGLMDIFNPAPQSTFPLGGLMDFNAMAADLAGPAPDASSLGGLLNAPIYNAPATLTSAGNIDLLTAPMIRPTVPGMAANQPGYNAELEAISRRAAIEAATGQPNPPNPNVSPRPANNFYQPSGRDLEALARRAAIERMR